MNYIRHFLPDNFILFLLTMVIIASIFPAHGIGIKFFNVLTTVAVALLFFLHGARLSRESIMAGALHWRLHLTIFSVTFLLFPILGLALKPVLQRIVAPEFYIGLLYVCCLPATVQSAIALTSIAKGNVPAAICSASTSSLLGIFVTPILVGLIIPHTGTMQISFDAAVKIMLQLLLPFVLGQIMRTWICTWVIKHKKMLKMMDQLSILLVVYTAFSDAIIGGLWQNTTISAIFGLIAGCSILLAIILSVTTFLGKCLKFDTPDRIVLLFCGSKKSLASGVPMAQVLFASSAVGTLVLPLMIFHQIQLMVCTVLASRYDQRRDAVDLLKFSK